MSDEDIWEVSVERSRLEPTKFALVAYRNGDPVKRTGASYPTDKAADRAAAGFLAAVRTDFGRMPSDDPTA